jgi:hypothetical protein
MNQATLLRESRSKHLLQNSEVAVKQFRVFKAVLPITTKHSEFSAKLPKKKTSISTPRQMS